MSALKILLFKMKDLTLMLCLLGMSFAVLVSQSILEYALEKTPDSWTPNNTEGKLTGSPCTGSTELMQWLVPDESKVTVGLLEAIFRQPRTPGMASLNLEKIRRLGSLQGQNILPQFSRFGSGKSLNSLWMHALLPPHSSFPWMRQREQETQQYEHSLPVHPPPPPSQQSLKPQQPEQKPFPQPTVATGIRDTAQKGGLHSPVHQGPPPTQQGEMPAIQQQGTTSEKTPKPEIFPIARLISLGPRQQTKQSELYPGMFYMSYEANQLNAPSRFDIMSSEEMVGGRGSPMAYGAMFPGFQGMKPGFGGMFPNPAMHGDFTLQFDSPDARIKGPEKGEGGAQGSPFQRLTHPSRKTQPSFQKYHLVPTEDFLLSLRATFPAWQRALQGRAGDPPRATSAAADLLITPGLAEAYGTNDADVTTPQGIQEKATADSTGTPDTEQTLMLVNKVQQPRVMQHGWHFQKPQQP